MWEGGGGGGERGGEWGSADTLYLNTLLNRGSKYFFPYETGQEVGGGGGGAGGLLRGCGIVGVQYLFLQMLQGGEGCQ